MDISIFSFFLFPCYLFFSILLLAHPSFSLSFALSVSLSFLFSGSVCRIFPLFDSFSRSLPFTLSVSYSLSSGQFPIFMLILFAQFPFSFIFLCNQSTFPGNLFNHFKALCSVRSNSSCFLSFSWQAQPGFVEKKYFFGANPYRLWLIASDARRLRG